MHSVGSSSTGWNGARKIPLRSLMVMTFPFGDNFPPYDILSGESQGGVSRTALDPTKSSVRAVQQSQSVYRFLQNEYPACRISLDTKTIFAFLRCAASTRTALVFDKRVYPTA